MAVRRCSGRAGGAVADTPAQAAAHKSVIGHCCIRPCRFFRLIRYRLHEYPTLTVCPPAGRHRRADFRRGIPLA
jgi:hypothetical protein